MLLMVQGWRLTEVSCGTVWQIETSPGKGSGGQMPPVRISLLFRFLMDHLYNKESVPR